jgi:hypothetical protein
VQPPVANRYSQPHDCLQEGFSFGFGGSDGEQQKSEGEQKRDLDVGNTERMEENGGERGGE